MAPATTHLDDLLAIYDGATFQDQVEEDLNDGAVWFNVEEFGRMRDVDGVKVMSIFCKDKRTRLLDVGRNRDERPPGVTDRGGVLFLRVDEVNGVYKAGSPLRLDGRLYTVEDADRVQGVVWRIVLEANVA